MFVSFSVAVHMLYFPENCVLVVKSLRGSVTAEILVGTQKCTLSKQIYQIHTVSGREKKWATILNLSDSRSFNSFSSCFFLFHSSFEQCVVTVGSSGVD